MKQPLPKPLIFLVGPTASGKSAIAIHLARMINGEIISCDSMQVYKGMDIITSKPAASLRRKVKHHLIDIVSCKKEYNVFQYRKAALKIIRQVLKRGKIPLFVGGTGLYVSVLTDGIFQGASTNMRIRSLFYKDAKIHGSGYLYERLKEVDPVAAEKIHPNDTKRIIRALEVFQSTGKPISFLQKQRIGLRQNYDIKIYCLNRKREDLYKRIEQRVDKMFQQGLVREVKNFTNRGLSRTASFAIGARELQGVFKGEYDLDEARRLIKHNSRLYAKRQLTWFRKDKSIEWVNVLGKETPKETARRIAKIWRKHYLLP